MLNKFDNHCTQKNCTCDHTTCYRGWLDYAGITTPCQWCRPNTHQRWLKREAARHKGYPLAALSRIMAPEQNKWGK